MKTSFLDYYKLILDKVSFDRQLFRKEYHKAVKRLQKVERIQLHVWLKARGLYYHLSEGEKLEGARSTEANRARA